MMIKHILKLLVCMGIALLFIFSGVSLFPELVTTATAATLEVGQGQAYTTIQSAIDAAKTGDTILVNEGIYRENPRIKINGISLMGKNMEKSIIDGRTTSSGIRIDEMNNVVISGFTIQNSGGGGQEDAGVVIYKGNGNTISNLIITGNSVGISIYQGSNRNNISGNLIESNLRYGIHLYASDENNIFNNNIKNNNIGIYAFASKKNRIYQNNLIDNKDQTYDNSGLNLWDLDKRGNYWSDYKGNGAYVIALGGKNAKDNFPQAMAFSIKSKPIILPGQKEAHPGTSTSGFTAIVAIVSLIVTGKFGMKNR